MKRRFITLGKKLFFLFKRKKTKPFVYVAIGDSTVEGVGATTIDRSFAGRTCTFLQQHKKNVAYYNFGKAEATVQDVLEQQLPKTIEKNPDLVLIAVGTNDIRFHTSAKNFEKRYARLLTTLKIQTQAVIVVNTIPDISALRTVPQLVKLYCKWIVLRFNARINKHAQQRGVSVVDAYKISCDLRRIYKNYKELLFIDGIHPSDKGYALWAESIIRQISPSVC